MGRTRILIRAGLAQNSSDHWARARVCRPVIVFTFVHTRTAARPWIDHEVPTLISSLFRRTSRWLKAPRCSATLRVAEHCRPCVLVMAARELVARAARGTAANTFALMILSRALSGSAGLKRTLHESSSCKAAAAVAKDHSTEPLEKPWRLNAAETRDKNYISVCAIVRASFLLERPKDESGSCASLHFAVVTNKPPSFVKVLPIVFGVLVAVGASRTEI